MSFEKLKRVIYDDMIGSSTSSTSTSFRDIDDNLLVDVQDFDFEDIASVPRKYGMRIPKRIILIRHGESTGNVNENVYTTVPDWKVPLTENGKMQAVETGKRVKQLIGDDPVSIYCSPYLRTKQTLLGVLSELKSNRIISAREEPRITEQQFGNFQNYEDMSKYKECRKEFGRFYYRFPDGESGLDVYDRVSLFIGTLWRDWDKIQDIESSNVLVVTHGITLRLFLMRWYQYTVAEFEQSINPPNGSLIVMQRLSKSELSNRNIAISSEDYGSSSKASPLPPRIVPRERTVFTLDTEYRSILGLSENLPHSEDISKFLLSIESTDCENINITEKKRRKSVKLHDRSIIDELKIMFEEATV